MKLASLSFNDQNKYSQNGLPVQASKAETPKAVKLLAARLCLSIIETHYRLTMAEINRKYPSEANEVCAALYKLTQERSHQRLKEAAHRLLCELDDQANCH